MLQHARRDDIHSVIDYVNHYRYHLEAYVTSRYPKQSERPHYRDLIANPYLARTCIENFRTPDHEKWNQIAEVLAYAQDGAGIVLTLGARGSRKTMTTFDIVNEVRLITGRRVVAIGMEKAGPPWVQHILTIDDAKKDDIVVQDEAGSELNARDSMRAENRALGPILNQARHNGNLVFFITQNSSGGDKSIVAAADHFLIKRFSLAQDGTERAAVKSIVGPWLDEFSPRDPEETLFVSDRTNPWFLRRDVPDWWKWEYSFAYGKIDRERATQIAHQYHLGGMTWNTIASRLRTRGQKKSASTWAKEVRKRCDCDTCANSVTKQPTEAKAKKKAVDPRWEGVRKPATRV